MCVKLPSWSCSTKFRSQDSCLAFIHEPSPSRSITLHLSSIEVASQFNPGPHIHISPPYKHPCILKSQLHPGHVSPQSRSWYLHLTSIPVTPHLHPCPEKCSSATPMSISQTHTGPLHLHLGSASPASRSKGSSYHRDPCTVSPPPISHITFCQFMRCAAQVHQCPVSTPSKAPRFATLTPSGSCLTSIQVVYHLHPGSDKFHLHLGSASPASRSKDSYIIAIHVSSHRNPGHISPSFISQSVLLKFIHVQSQPHPKSHFHPFHVSPPSRSR